MRIISIEDPPVIRTILEHLGLWLVKARAPPKTQTLMAGYGRMDAVSGHEQPDDLNYADPDYTWDAFIHS